jgi:hypothetical protein
VSVEGKSKSEPGHGLGLSGTFPGSQKYRDATFSLRLHPSNFKVHDLEKNSEPFHPDRCPVPTVK